MKKTKIKNLFNKNHITITKKENCSNDTVSCNIKLVEKDTDDYSYYSIRKRNQTKEIIKCKSPLGFYYNKTVYNNRTNTSSSSKIRKIEISLKDSAYELSYYIKYGDTTISKENRPWEIVEGDPSFSDKMANSLLEEINKLLDILSDNKIKPNVCKTAYSYSNYKSYSGEITISDLKIILYEELFGDKNGIRYQTDSEKIVSHGFDLKTSFRKPKQK